MAFKNKKFKGKITLHGKGGIIDTPIPLVDIERFNPKEETYNDYPKAASDNAQRALDWLRENENPNDYLTAVGFARANQLAKREPISYETVQRMARFICAENNKNVPYEEGSGGIAWDAWGGDEGVNWAIDTVERVEAEIAEEEEKEQQSNKAENNALKLSLSRAAQSFRSALRPQEAPENAQIDPEQMLLVPFRLISSTIVGANSYKATYFPPDILEASMPLLQNKPVYRNHYMDPDCWLGIVQQVEWGNSYIQDGVTVPAGINGMLAIDTQNEKNAELARGIVVKAVRSNSVTVEFNWIPSHDFEYEWQFWESLGSMVDGRMVTRVVTEVLDYHETSIVGLGADPFAKLIDDLGELVDIDLANMEEEPIQDLFFENEGQRIEMRQYAKASQFAIENNLLNKPTEMAKEKKEFATGFGQTLDEAVKNIMEQQNLGRGDVIQRLADSAGVTVRTVQMYVSGKNACPKLEYLDKFAKVLMIGTKKLVDSAVADGCSYGKDELQALLAGNALEKKEEEEMDGHEDEEEMNLSRENLKAGDDNDEEDEEEMSKDEGDEEEMSKDEDEDSEEMASANNGMDLILAKLDALQSELNTFKAEKTESTKTIENNAETTETKETVENTVETTEETKTEKQENSAEGKLSAEKEETLEEYKTLLATYKREAENAKAELTATTNAYKTKQNENANAVANLRAELIDLKIELEKVRQEKAAAELEKNDANELRMQLKQNEKRLGELSAMVDNYKEVEHFTEAGKQHFEAMKAEAIRLYNAKVGKYASEAVVQLFENANTLDAVKGLVQQYGKELTAEFAVQCKDCGSANCEFGSVVRGYSDDQIFTQSPIMNDDQLRERLNWD